MYKDKDVVLIVGSVAALVAISAATFLCSLRRRSASQRSDARGHEDVELGRGVDEAVLAAYPTMVFSPSPPQHVDDGEKTEDEESAGRMTPPAGDTAARCAVCQEDYADGDELRLLPECQHAFHRRCVDQWLRRRATCPVCRASPPAS